MAESAYRIVTSISIQTATDASKRIVGTLMLLGDITHHMVISTTESGENRAVSPVIGVILMVAITVILAAVIGAFVLEIGDQEETAPNTSFDSEQKEAFIEVNPGHVTNANITQVKVNHAGGEVLDISQVRLSVNGNESVWGIRYHTSESPNSYSSNVPKPQPEVWDTWGSNQPVEFSSGETWNAVGYCGPICEDALQTLPPHENIPLKTTKYMYFDNMNADSGDVKYTDEVDSNDCPKYTGSGTRSCDWYIIGTADWIDSGDTLRAVWRAESGGKTQTLFKYTVQ